MRAPPMRGRVLFSLWALLLVGLCHCDDGLVSDRSAVAVGTVECADCIQQKIKSSDAFSGLRVAIDCKAANSKFTTRGVGELDKDGKFRVELPSELLNDDGELKEECFAQLHSASQTPCPAHNGLDPAKIVLKSKDNGKHTFSTAGKLSFTPAICSSELLLPFFKKPLPPHTFKKPLPPIPPVYKKPFPPIYKKPFPPIYKKPFPPKPTVPPFDEKPFAPLPKFPPIYKKKPFPHLPKFHHIYKKKPFSPPLPKFPPIYKKKPLPDLPKFPPIYKKKPLPTIYPPFGGYPPLTPYSP